MPTHGPVLRVFDVHPKPGRTAELLEKFATASAAVVSGEPGNRGYFFGRCIEGDGDKVMFVSVWKDLDAIKARFGDQWQESFLPDGYADMIETCWLRHIDLDGGWNVAAL